MTSNPAAPPAPCPVCGNARVRVAANLANHFDAVRCPSCGLLYADPMPRLTLESLQAIYDDEYTDAMRTTGDDARKNEALRRATHLQMDFVERHVPRGDALNVGAMSDASLVLAERGWRLRVVDASRHAAETARALWGLDVTVARFEDFEAPPGSFDFIKLGHVIEHLPDPRVALDRMAALLRPGGVALIDTDNVEGIRSEAEFCVRRVLGERLAATLVRALTKKELGTRYGRLIPPVHLCCYSERSLTRLVRDSGLQVVEVRKPGWGDPTWFPLIREGLSLAERAALAVDRFGASVGRGEVLVVLVKKP